MRIRNCLASLATLAVACCIWRRAIWLGSDAYLDVHGSGDSSTDSIPSFACGGLAMLIGLLAIVVQFRGNVFRTFSEVDRRPGRRPDRHPDDDNPLFD